MAKGLAGANCFGAALYAGALGRSGSLSMAVAALAEGLFMEVFIGDIGDIALVDITVQSGRGYCPFLCPAEGARYLVWGAAFLNLLRYIVSIGMVMAQLDILALGGSLEVGIVLGDFCGIMIRAASGFRSKMRI